jgi:hypothetical protein
MLGVALGEALKGIQSAEPDRGLLVAKLLHGLGKELGDAPLLGVDLIQALAPVGQQQVGRSAGAEGDRRAGLDRVGLERRMSRVSWNFGERAPCCVAS